MSYKVYSTKSDNTSGFPLRDSMGYYINVPDSDFIRLSIEGVIFEKDGIYYSNEKPKFQVDTNPMNYHNTNSSYSANSSSSHAIYSNPGKTAKRFAQVLFIIGVILSVVLGIIIGKSTGYNYYDYFTGESSNSFNYIVFLLISAVGSIISYVSALGLAVIGDIASNINELNQKVKR